MATVFSKLDRQIVAVVKPVFDMCLEIQPQFLVGWISAHLSVEQRFEN